MKLKILLVGVSLLVAGALVGPVVARNWSNIVDKLDGPEERVAKARAETESGLRARFKEVGVPYPAKRLFFRAFKRERELEMWAGDSTGQLKLIQTYDVAAASGGLGPKRKEGDRQVPEGVYVVDRFNPRSSFHLSLGLNYPNASDRIRSDRKKPGGDIFIHGDQRSIGCLAMTDPKIREIYVVALDAKRPIRGPYFSDSAQRGGDEGVGVVPPRVDGVLARAAADLCRVREEPAGAQGVGECLGRLPLKVVPERARPPTSSALEPSIDHDPLLNRRTGLGIRHPSCA